MYVVCVSVQVKTEFSERFVEATLDNARNTRKEPGNLRFDVLRREDDPNRFFLYEVYKDKEAFARHQETGHYIKWRDTVQDWMAERRVGLRHVAVYFGDEEAQSGPE